MSFENIFRRKPEFFDFQGTKLPVWHINYWLIQGPLIGIPYDHYYDEFAENGWAHVPQGKPVIFAISHRNAFMDSLAFVNLHNTQVWQLARGDAFKNPLMRKLFYFFHMLPIWRERDGVDTKTANNDTFKACHDILYHHGMIGIYPEGDCVNERHIRPLKKGICRIAFGAMESYDWDMDLYIVPVGISYSGAEKFKKWQLVNFGKPLQISAYREYYEKSASGGVNKLKDDLQNALQSLVVHIPHSHYHHTIDQAAEITARHNILQRKQAYLPLSRLEEEKSIVEKLEHCRHQNPDAMTNLAHHVSSYVSVRDRNDFRENTFDPERQTLAHHFAAACMLLLFLPLFFAGVLAQWIPYKLPEWYVRRNIKKKIFYSSLQYALALGTFLIYYLLVLVTVWIWTSSLFYALAAILILPFLGNFAFYYWRLFKRWVSVSRFMVKRNSREMSDMMRHRKAIIDFVNGL